MNYQEASLRLKNHANLPGAGSEAESLGYALWKLHRGDDDAANELPALYNDVLDCLESINLELNGTVPSETPNSQKQMTVDRWLAYSITSLMDLHLEVLRVSPHFADATRKFVLGLLSDISIAWSAVLAGDIDSVRECVELERWARG